jgi:hypothetical protein
MRISRQLVERLNERRPDQATLYWTGQRAKKGLGTSLIARKGLRHLGERTDLVFREGLMLHNNCPSCATARRSQRSTACLIRSSTREDCARPIPDGRNRTWTL